ncbi:siderophore-interacting protein [Serinibacter salmoneus]|uniref:NADPH-dependent ferric siderophore reductase n=1 Tax=Serinibacter salmoneus TaxID=556530 RepID=A0A2A9D223_9MICO|nr:siderophore-interacting protein [Serinibacter salmoneus]PFG20768.1 NADPH-dependent ferric siderophore reductase [Serinibacter salmoneus]
MPKGTVTAMQVVGKSWITPHLVRLELAGPDGAALADFPMSPHADAYVKLVLPPRGVSLPWPYDAEALKQALPPEQWPVLRTYTIRDFTPQRMMIDVVVHGDDGVAGPWARDVEPCGPGSLLQVRGPGGAYSPDPSARHHLLVGDASALPAIAVALERLRPGATADVVIGVASAADEIPLDTRATAQITWVHEGAAAAGPGEALVAAVHALDLPEGEGIDAFVHGEAGWVKALRRHLRFERGIPRERLSISGYWRLGSTDEQWRTGKAQWRAEVEADEAAAGLR